MFRTKLDLKVRTKNVANKIGIISQNEKCFEQNWNYKSKRKMFPTKLDVKVGTKNVSKKTRLKVRMKSV